MNERLNYYDVLKAVAILFVVLYHFSNKLLPGGYLGVDIFFVVNGFLLARSIDKLGSWVDWPVFLSRRLIRLSPVLLIAVLFCLIWGAYWLVPHSYQDVAQSSFASIFFVNNVLLYIESRDYWTVFNEFKPLMQTWYLSVIVQLYVFISLVVILVRKSSSFFLKKYISAEGVMYTLFCISVILNFLPYWRDSASFYFFPFRLYELCYGYMMAKLLSVFRERGVFPWLFSGKEKMSYLKDAVARYGGVVLYGFLFLFICCMAPLLTPKVAIPITVCMSGCFLLVLPYGKGFLAPIVNCKFLASIGRASFSIYIWHQVVIAFYKASWEYNVTYVQMLCLSVGIAIISFVSYRWIEMPVAALSKDARKSLMLHVGVWGSAAVLAGLSLFLHFRQGVIRDVPELDIYVDQSRNVDLSAYNDAMYQYMERPFSQDAKQHWAVFGDSFGRDWTNVLSESVVWDELELSYVFPRVIYSDKIAEIAKNADVIFLALGTHPTPQVVNIFMDSLDKYGIDKNKVYITGSKRLGYSVDQVYRHRNESDYPNIHMTMYVKDAEFEMNERIKEMCGDKFIDLYVPIVMGKNRVRAFDDEGKFLSQDTAHLTRAGARFYANYYRDLLMKILTESRK